jgi:hypothetical protein
MRKRPDLPTSLLLAALVSSGAARELPRPSFENTVIVSIEHDPPDAAAIPPAG